MSANSSGDMIFSLPSAFLLTKYRGVECRSLLQVESHWNFYTMHPCGSKILEMLIQLQNIYKDYHKIVFPAFLINIGDFHCIHRNSKLYLSMLSPSFLNIIQLKTDFYNTQKTADHIP